MDRLAFSASVFLRPCRYAVRNFPQHGAKWCCSYSSSAPRGAAGRGGWDLDNSFDFKSSPSKSSYDKPRGTYRSRRGYEDRPSTGSSRSNSRDRPSATRSRTSPKFRPQPRGSWNSGPRDYERQSNYNSRPRYDSSFDDDDESFEGGRGSYIDSEDDSDFPKRREFDDQRYGRNRRQAPNFQRYRSEGQYGRGSSSSEPLSRERKLIRQALDSETEDLLYGISPVLLALKSDLRKKFVQLFVQKRGSDDGAGDGSRGAGPTRKAENADALEEILTLASRYEVPVVKVSKGDLNLLSENRPHQGVVLQAAKREFFDLKQLPEVTADWKNDDERTPCYLVLDEITDPQNAGALLRSAHFLGADGVIVCKRNSAGLSAVVSKASAGAMEIMEVYGISSMPRFLRASRDRGWRVVGMACGEGAIASKQLALDQPTLVVLGSEGRGLRTMVKQACDVVVQIEGWGDDSEVDSLNVSVAGAVALYQLLGR